VKPRNRRIYSADIEYLRRLQQEYKDYGDWDTELEGNTLTIFALHRKYQRRKDKAAQARREKRTERFAKKKYQKTDA
jgi:hypothetical protein